MNTLPKYIKIKNMPKLRELTPFFSAQSLYKECVEHLEDMEYSRQHGHILNDVVYVNVYELKRLCEYVLFQEETNGNDR